MKIIKTIFLCNIFVKVLAHLQGSFARLICNITCLAKLVGHIHSFFVYEYLLAREEYSYFPVNFRRMEFLFFDFDDVK